jgi:hypothetical protein
MKVCTLIFAALAACADNTVPDEPDVLENPNLADPETNAQLYSGTLCEISADVNEGPCLLACDPDALIDQWVPKGTCVAFECPLSDGTNVRIGGCNP